MDPPVTAKAPGPLGPGDPGTQLPEWELPPVEEKRKSRLSILGVPAVATVNSTPLTKKWSSTMADMKRDITGLSRPTCIIVSIVAAVVLIALAVGLGVGLGLKKKSGGSQNLPLPGGAKTYVGDLTYYGVGLGACGLTSTANEDIVAISHAVFDAAQTGSDPNANPLCGQKIRAKRYYAELGAERSVDLTVVDRCVGCQPTDLDVSTGAFDQLGPEESGRVDVTWAWLTPAATSN